MRGLFEIGDEVGALLLVLDAGIRHLRPRHCFQRISEEAVESRFIPDEAGGFHGLRIVEAGEAAGRTAEGYSLYTYGSIQAWADAVNAAGSTDFDPVVAELDKGQFETVLGTLEFDEKGDVTLPGYVFYEWKDGKYDYME